MTMYLSEQLLGYTRGIDLRRTRKYATQSNWTLDGEETWWKSVTKVEFFSSFVTAVSFSPRP
jgi:hypothetical protein